MASIASHKPSHIELSPELTAELFAPAGWSEVLETFARTMRVGVALTDSQGSPLGACHNPQPIWTLAREARPESDSGHSFCLSPDLACTVVREAIQKGEIVIASDAAGLAYVAVPLSLDGQYPAGLIAGQVFDRYPESLRLQRTAKEFGIPEQRIWSEAIHQTPVSRATLRMYGELLQALGQAFLQQRYGAIAERKLNQTNSRFRLLVESLKEYAVFTVDAAGKVTSWNSGAERIFGYTADEIVGHSVIMLIPPELQHEEPGILARLRKGERIDHYETIRRRKDGIDVQVSLTVSPLKDETGKIIGASKIARDITEKKRAQMIQQTLYELTSAVNRAVALPDIYDAALKAVCQCQSAQRAAVLLYDADGAMRFKAWRNLSDEYRHAVEGHSPWQRDDPSPQPVCMDNVIHAPLEDHLRAVINREGIQSLAFLPITYENRLLGKFMVYYDAPRHFTAEELQPAQTIVSQVAFAIERRRSGETLERMVNERTASLREAIAQMEEFSYSVSHDLRAPVRAMQCYAEVLMEDYGAQLDEHAKKYLDRIIHGGTRMDRLIQDILTYSRLSRREIQLHPISLDKLTREIVRQYLDLGSAANPDISVEGHLSTVIGHEPSLSQAISNLLNNAVKFVAPGTAPKVHVRTERRNGDVRLWIEDNGIGIKPEYQHRLFSVFERVHPEKNYEGTGIGLAIVRKAAERMGGKAGVESDGVNGSKFWIQLPAAENPSL